MGKVRHRDEGATWKFSVGKHFVPDFNETVAVARIVYRDCHGDEIGELAARALERPIDESEAGSGLSLEIVRDRFSVQISERRLPGEPNNLATFGDDSRREGARFLKLGAFQMDQGAMCCH